ncbi:vitamin B12 dependent-methionine synthase activation domain-containing protein, partial [Brucella abortus]|nr:vitamin B12 dependent-methionine synthase activation domain-containing protein [Brucella abortus]
MPRWLLPMPATRLKNSACQLPARANPHQLDWENYEPVKSVFTGTKVFETYDLAEIARYIGWTPFFQTWELRGRYPAILEDEKQQGGGAASSGRMRKRCSGRSSMRNGSPTRAVVGFWPANAVGDDIRLFTDESRKEELATLFTLRQQLAKRDGRPSVAMADFVAPVESG